MHSTEPLKSSATPERTKLQARTRALLAREVREMEQPELEVLAESLSAIDFEGNPVSCECQSLACTNSSTVIPADRMRLRNVPFATSL